MGGGFCRGSARGHLGRDDETGHSGETGAFPGMLLGPGARVGQADEIAGRGFHGIDQGRFGGFLL